MTFGRVRECLRGRILKVIISVFPIFVSLYFQIAELPESFSKLSKLKTLDLFCNRLREIPSVLRDLTSLVRLDIEAVRLRLHVFA